MAPQEPGVALDSGQRAEWYMTTTIGVAMKAKRATKVKLAKKMKLAMNVKRAMKIKVETGSASKILMCLIEMLRFTLCLGPSMLALATSPEGSNLPRQEEIDGRNYRAQQDYDR